MSEPKSYKEMWAQWDDLKAKSRNAFETAKEEIAKLEGWKFKGLSEAIPPISPCGLYHTRHRPV